MFQSAIGGGVAAVCLAVSAPVFASEWSVNHDQSRLEFAGSQLGAAFEGVFEDFAAEIVFDPENPGAASVTTIIQMASARTGDRQIDGALPGADWFHVAEYPTARFVATSFEQSGENEYEAKGALTIRDQTNDVALPFTLEIDGDAASMQGALTIDRRDYGVGQGEWESDRFVGATVEIRISLSASRAN